MRCLLFDHQEASTLSALTGCPLGFDKSDKAELLAVRKRFFWEGENDASIRVESVQGGRHRAAFRFQRVTFKIEFGLDAWDFLIPAN